MQKKILVNLMEKVLLDQQTAKAKIKVTVEEINKKYQQFQGERSKEEFQKQLKIRLQLNRILEKEISITPEEVDKYIKDNAKSLVATVEAERKIEATETIREQKISSMIQQWVNDLLAKAKITRFLK